MRVFKIILNIFMAIVLILSLTFCFLISSSSYGTLLFKHNDSKMLSMANVERLSFDSSQFFYNKNCGIQIYKETIDEKDTTKKNYKLYFDNDFNLTASIYTSSKKGDNIKETTTYYKNGESYDEKGSKIGVSTEIVDILTEINVLQDLII